MRTFKTLGRAALLALSVALWCVFAERLGRALGWRPWIDDDDPAR